MFRGSAESTATTDPSDCLVTEVMKTLVEPTPASEAVSHRRAAAVAVPRDARGRLSLRVREEVGVAVTPEEEEL